MVTARRDAKQVVALASAGMTESEYQATISAERTFGRIQVHQRFRALARELGLPDDCSLPIYVRPWLPRWYVDPDAVRQERWQAYDRAMSVSLRYMFGAPAITQHPFSWEPQYTSVA